MIPTNRDILLCHSDAATEGRKFAWIHPSGLIPGPHPRCGSCRRTVLGGARIQSGITYAFYRLVFSMVLTWNSSSSVLSFRMLVFLKLTGQLLYCHLGCLSDVFLYIRWYMRHLCRRSIVEAMLQFSPCIVRWYTTGVLFLL